MKINQPIAFINYSLSGGGAERNVINLSNYFITHHQPVNILLFKEINDYKEECGHVPINDRIISIFKFQHKISAYLLPIYFVRLLLRLSFLIQKNKYRLLIAPQEYIPYYMVIFLSKLFRIKNLLIVSNNIEAILYSKKIIPRLLHTVLFHISFFFSDKIICLSHGLKESLIRVFGISPEKISVINTGVDEVLIKKILINDLRKNNLLNGRPVITSMGRLVPQKGFIHLIRAFSRVVKIFPKAMLVIIGKGPQKKELTRLAFKLKLNKNIEFPGFLEPYNLLKQVDIFVFSSLYEGFGNVLIEAMHCGVPVISMDCPYGPREIIENNKWGILTPAINPKDTKEMQNRKEQLFANEIIRLLKNKTLLNKYKELSHRRAKSFTLDIMGKNYLRIIRSMIK